MKLPLPVRPEMSLEDLQDTAVIAQGLPDPMLWLRLHTEIQDRLNKLGSAERNARRYKKAVLRGLLNTFARMLEREEDAVFFLATGIPDRICAVRDALDAEDAVPCAADIASQLRAIQKSMNHLGGDTARKALLAKRLGSHERVDEFLRTNRASVKELVHLAEKFFRIRIDHRAGKK